MNRTHVGIYSVGVFLPEQVRTNDWWSPQTIAGWGQTHTGRLDRPPEGPDELETEGGRMVLEAMRHFRDDPFKGARARRVMAEGQHTSDMEVAAVEDALDRAGLTPKDVDLLLATTCLPDYLMVPNACRVHERLGMSPRCFSMQTEGVCNAFLMQLSLAEQMIASGQARHAVLVQSSAMSRLTKPEDAMSGLFGDAATAVVVGPVEEGHGVLGRAHMTDGSLYGGVVCGVPGKEWYEMGEVQGFVLDPRLARRLLTSNIHDSKALILDAIAQAGLTPRDVDFYASHQGFVWLREVTQKLAGIEQARVADTFPWAASCLGCNVPLSLYSGLKENQIRDGEVVSMFSGAAGSVLSSLVLRWGGRPT